MKIAQVHTHTDRQTKTLFKRSNYFKNQKIIDYFEKIFKLILDMI